MSEWVQNKEKEFSDILKEEKGKITYPINPFEILKANNVIITFSDFDKLEGLLLFDKQKESIVSINLNRPITRQRFTAAHELGHIMLHTEVKGENFLCPIFGQKSPVEREADDFASYLLMPNDELNKLVDKELTRTDIFELKQAVEDHGFLWGIIDIPLANENKQIYNLETLQGRYGLKINE